MAMFPEIEDPPTHEFIKDHKKLHLSCLNAWFLINMHVNQSSKCHIRRFRVIFFLGMREIYNANLRDRANTCQTKVCGLLM
ncbi:hypothetical protein J6590_018529, partial [Homalodisca vitripennis]